MKKKRLKKIKIIITITAIIMFNSYLRCVLKTFEGEEKEAIKVCRNMMCAHLKWKTENVRNRDTWWASLVCLLCTCGPQFPLCLPLFKFIWVICSLFCSPCFWSMRLLYYPDFVNHFSFLIYNKAGVNSVKQLLPTTYIAKGIGKGQQMRIWTLIWEF